jgi:hypothetical protein
VSGGIYTAVTCFFVVSYLTCFLGFNLKDALFYQMLLTLVGAMATGPMIKLCVESFPVQVRYTGMGLTQGLAFPLLGGTAPMVLLVLIHRFGVYAPAFYLMLFTAVALFFLPKRH